MVVSRGQARWIKGDGALVLLFLSPFSSSHCKQIELDRKKRKEKQKKEEEEEEEEEWENGGVPEKGRNLTISSLDRVTKRPLAPPE